MDISKDVELSQAELFIVKQVLKIGKKKIKKNKEKINEFVSNLLRHDLKGNEIKTAFFVYECENQIFGKIVTVDSESRIRRVVSEDLQLTDFILKLIDNVFDNG